MNVAAVQSPLTLVQPESLARAGSGGSPGGAFARMIDQVLHQANATQAQADQAVRDLAMGRTDNLHQVLLTVAKADLTLRLALEIRNKLTEAMQQVMAMQV